MKTPFSTLLVANRGEIALRVMKSARAAGLKCIAVYTDADAGAPHVAYADQAVRIGEGPAADSYLSIDKILGAVGESGAQAVHPGYGFLSESAEFAQACRDAGLVFVGPSAESITLMGNKAAAKRKMIAAGVPCVPGYGGEDQSPDGLAQQAERIGFPVMIKAAKGGGGRGIRLARDRIGFLAGLDMAKAEALTAFGSDEVILERAVQRPRHVEVQIIADRYGTVIHLGERDCSVQRRHQKVIEEAPCPGLTPDMRAEMAAAAVDAVKSIGYEGAGTVEFLLEASGAFHFLEMNTRLQVEHPVTEMVTGLDLVALQLSVAAGEPLALSQGDISITGHAIEARLYSEDPADGFLPTTGNIRVWQPATGAGIRTDAGIVSGQKISPFYDSMLAKVIAHGLTRATACENLKQALADTVLLGPANNRDFLIDLLGHDTFAGGQVTTGFIAQEYTDTACEKFSPAFSNVALAGALLNDELQKSAERTAVAMSPELRGWSSSGVLRSGLTLQNERCVFHLTLTTARDGAVTLSDTDRRVTITTDDNVIRIDGQRIDLRAVHYDGSKIHIATGTRSFGLKHKRVSAQATEAVGTGNIIAPMHGILQEVLVSEGDLVVSGQRVAILEAMKMQHELLAQVSGRVKAVLAAPGAQVRAGQLLIETEFLET